MDRIAAFRKGNNMQLKTRVLVGISTVIVAGAPSIVGIASPAFAARPGPSCPATNTPEHVKQAAR